MYSQHLRGALPTVFALFVSLVILGCGGSGTSSTGSSGSTGEQSDPGVRIFGGGSHDDHAGADGQPDVVVANANSVKTSNIGTTTVNGTLAVSPTFSSDYTITVSGQSDKTATLHITVTRPAPRFILVGNPSHPRHSAEYNRYFKRSGSVIRAVNDAHVSGHL